MKRACGLLPVPVRRPMQWACRCDRVLALARGVPHWLSAQQRRVSLVAWQVPPCSDRLRYCRHGYIGTVIARVLHAAGMKLSASAAT
jgi:hypothetical protein